MVWRTLCRKPLLKSGARTSPIRAVEFTPSSDGDSPVLPELLGQIPEGEDIGTVSADGAYDTRCCHTLPSSTGRPLQSSRSARTVGRGNKTARPQSLATKRCVPPGTMEGRSGSAGPAITSQAGSRPRCAASRHSANASPRETQTAKLPKKNPHRPHQPLQYARHRRDRQHGLTSTGKGKITPQK